jgi:recombination protein RecA
MSKAQELAAMVNAALGTKTKPANVVKMASDPYLKVTYLKTNVLPFDLLLKGGIPRGRMIEVFGDYSTLKTFVGLKAIAQCQSEGGTAALIDTEGAFDPDWATSLGVNVDDLIIWPERNDDEVHTGEEAIDVAQTLIMGKLDLLVFDSIAATAPKDVMSKRMAGENIQPARLAALMSEALRRLTTVNGKTAIMFINQTRINVGVTFGSNEALPGGKAMPFYASYRIRLKKTGKVTQAKKVWDGTAWIDTKQTIGQKFVAMLEKSKLSSPHTEMHFVWDFNDAAIDETGFLVAQGMEHGFVETKGNTWAIPGTPYKAVGRDKFLTMEKQTPDAQAALQKKVMEREQPSASPGSVTPRKRKAVVKRRAS